MSLRIKSLFLFLIFIASSVFAAPAQKAFSDWQVTCNNQNFCAARNTGLHKGLVMTLTRSAGAHTDATLRIDLGNMTTTEVKSPPIAQQLLVDGEPLTLDLAKWQVTPHHLKTGDGYEVGEVEKVFELYMSPGGVTELIHFYMAEYSDAQRDNAGGGIDDEDIDVLEIPFLQALEMVASGEIRDGKTVILLQQLQLRGIMN